jgi:hypothetical protein
MNVNKKLDRLKQWAGERMGGEAKTSVSEDFKALEIEMNLRYEGEPEIGLIPFLMLISEKGWNASRNQWQPM